MESSKGLPDMGVIVCSQCGNEIETIPTIKVVTLYGLCQGHECPLDQEMKEEDRRG
ncbi:hypothetical protein GCM10011391_34870 [Pullulanibacillus camelliae]|uniref:GapA-binding peptide SR1P n=1 Tax=Pullulanibacillus camelliae TaxID=1707096 RepID=A0A8J2YMP1_9BACL|nr:GapA-binding peptide SR1P [Pullulanibacillus camelliae]GGE53007.1 hypothetical protein GCM10011391_34870 [Pullulanibacillus camelliae]